MRVSGGSGLCSWGSVGDPGSVHEPDCRRDEAVSVVWDLGPDGPQPPARVEGPEQGVEGFAVDDEGLQVRRTALQSHSHVPAPAAFGVEADSSTRRSAPCHGPLRTAVSQPAGGPPSIHRARSPWSTTRRTKWSLRLAPPATEVHPVKCTAIRRRRGTCPAAGAFFPTGSIGGRLGHLSEGGRKKMRPAKQTKKQDFLCFFAGQFFFAPLSI